MFTLLQAAAQNLSRLERTTNHFQQIDKHTSNTTDDRFGWRHFPRQAWQLGLTVSNWK